MLYKSTRDNYEKVSAARAIQLGMVPNGGLFVPEEIPELSQDELLALQNADYQDIAVKILSLFLPDYTKEEIEHSVHDAYDYPNFSNKAVAPLYEVDEHTYVLELWHGPTAAFKDMALQVMPHLLSLALKKTKTDKEIVILVATSGDTGKAALEGFKDVSGIKIIVFYPYQGVSKIQELQMTTTDGVNTYAVAVQGNFDDCQSAVKEIFADDEFKQKLFVSGYQFSSANSINWGRLLPQIVYYAASYVNLVKQGKVNQDSKINFVVPTGNFGNILAGWYAKKMGIPINKLICASNENKVLTDFFATGCYNKNREFKQTKSPSMDILISSNLERFLYEMTGHQGEKIAHWMLDLNEKGSFTVDEKVKQDIDNIIWAGYAEEEETLAVIKEFFQAKGYTLDPHTAVGMKVYNNYVQETGDTTVTVVDATASPFKFNASVFEAIKGPGSCEKKGEFEILNELQSLISQPIHPGLKDLDKKPVVHTEVCTKKEIRDEIKKILKI